MKGVSTLLSAVFLILMTVVIAAFVSGWLTNLSTEQSGEIKNKTTERLGCQFSDMYIVNATYNCNGNCSAGTQHTLELYISNSGKKLLYFERAVIQNTTGSVFSLDFNATKSLSVGETLLVRNYTTETCNGINNTIDKIIVSSMNCPSNAFDSIPGSDVTYLNC
jgi:hypothetical protein